MGDDNTTKLEEHLATQQQILRDVQDIQTFYVARDVAEDLGGDLDELRRQVDDLHEAAVSSEQLGLIVNRLDEMGQTIESASRTSERLRADVVLPEAEEMAVRLVPSNSLGRLEEYRSDENKAYLFAGTFLGAVLEAPNHSVQQTHFVRR